MNDPDSGPPQCSTQVYFQKARRRSVPIIVGSYRDAFGHRLPTPASAPAAPRWDGIGFRRRSRVAALAASNRSRTSGSIGDEPARHGSAGFRLVGCHAHFPCTLLLFVLRAWTNDCQRMILPGLLWRRVFGLLALCHRNRASTWSSPECIPKLGADGLDDGAVNYRSRGGYTVFSKGLPSNQR